MNKEIKTLILFIAFGVTCYKGINLYINHIEKQYDENSIRQESLEYKHNNIEAQYSGLLTALEDKKGESNKNTNKEKAIIFNKQLDSLNNLATLQDKNLTESSYNCEIERQKGYLLRAEIINMEILSKSWIWVILGLTYLGWLIFNFIKEMKKSK